MFDLKRIFGAQNLSYYSESFFFSRICKDNVKMSQRRRKLYLYERVISYNSIQFYSPLTRKKGSCRLQKLSVMLK
jgi:hypothetical protein